MRQGRFSGLEFALKKRVESVKAGLWLVWARLLLDLDWAGQVKPVLALCLQAACEQISGCNEPAAISLRASFAAVCAPQLSADSATALIAAKPVKPCGRGVFRALNLLSKKEWKA